MRALVTGAGGFVGPHLLAELAQAGDEAHGFDLGSGPDLLDRAGWTELLGQWRPEVVYHLAGWSDVGASWDNPHDTFAVNAQGTLTVLDAAHHAGVKRVLVVSSADVYGLVPPEGLPLSEQAPLAPRSPYGVSKEAAEALGRHYGRARQLEVIIARPFNHLGPGQSPRFAAAGFAAQIAEAELRGGGRLAHGDLAARRDFTDVRDVVRAYRLLADRGIAGETYNICSGRAVSMEQILKTLLEATSVPIETQLDPERLRPIELPVLEGSPAKLMSATGWQPTYSLETTLGDVLNAARTHANSLRNHQ